MIAFGPAGTWRYGTLTPAAAMSFGNGCTGSAGVPAIVPKPWAGPWLGDRFEASFDNAPLGAALAVWGFSDSNWMGVPLPFALAPFGAGPGCKLLVSSDLPQFVLPSAPSTPIAEYASFVLPSHPSFLGAVMFLQVGFLDAGMGGAPVTTAGLKLTFGSK